MGVGAWVSPGGSTWLRHRQLAVPAGRGERDCRAVLLRVRSPARASALARTTSGSRGSGGSASCQGRSRRTLGRWIRICFTSLISSASHPSRRDEGGQPWGADLPGAVYGETRSSVGTFCEGRYEPPPAVGVTQRCTCRVESSAAGRWHEGATGWGRSARGAGPGRVRGLRPWCGWPRELAQDVADVLLTVSRLMNSSPARAWFGVPAASIASTCSSRPVSGSIRPAPPGQHFARSPAR